MTTDPPQDLTPPAHEVELAAKSLNEFASPAAEPRDEAQPVILRVGNLQVRFGGVQAVAGASFDVRRGTITGLIGPNGAGKSTVVNSIAGQIREAKGSVLFAGKEILGRRADEISRLGLRRTFQTANLFGRMTVMENMLMGAPPWEGESLHASFIGRRRWRRREALHWRLGR